MGQIVYGPGALFLTRTDIVGATPINVGLVNEFSIDEAGETKSLYGQKDYAYAVRRGTVKCTGKAKAAIMSAQALNVFNGNMITKGAQLLASLGEKLSIPTVSPFTVAGANAANFNSDLGVVYDGTQFPFQLVETLAGAGQYETSAGGTYTFDSLDGGMLVDASYSYSSATSAGGYQKITSAQNIGKMPTFQIDYVTTDPVGGTFYFRGYAAVSSKLSRSFKITDFMMPEIDFELGQNPAGQVYLESYSPQGA
jgi:hypothetical protein